MGLSVRLMELKSFLGAKRGDRARLYILVEKLMVLVMPLLSMDASFVVMKFGLALDRILSG